MKSELLSLKNLKIGMKLEGQIKNVTHFGVFVDIGIGKDALLHQSQFPKNNSGGKFKLGQSIQVVVKSIEQERQRVNLTAICWEVLKSVEKKNGKKVFKKGYIL